MNSTSEQTSWRTSSYSNGNGSCVAIAGAGASVGVRDTKQHGTGPELWVPAAAAQSFLAGVVNGTLTA